MISDRSAETASSSLAMRGFAPFFDSELGRQLLHCQQAVLDRCLAPLTGYSLLQLSAQPEAMLSAAAGVGQRLHLHFDRAVALSSPHCCGDYQQLPIASDCIDIALLHHVLDFSPDPHQMLRETDGVLTDGGHLLVVGFNPISCWPLYRSAIAFSRDWSLPKTAIRLARLIDWLSLLNYDILQRGSYFFRPPIGSTALLRKLQPLDRWGEKFHLPGGLCYVLLARKRALPVNPLRQQHWSATLRPAGGGKLGASATAVAVARCADK